MIDFNLQSQDPITALIKLNEVHTWFDAIHYIRNLPYGRNSNRTDITLVLKEGRGTCSSKHALLKKIADLNDNQNTELLIGIYKMNSYNTPGIGNILLKNNLDYIPEAHCYLRHHSKIIDATSNTSNFEKIKKFVMVEKMIQPDQVGDFKIMFHQKFIKQWIVSEKLDFTFDEIWSIREQCILNLSRDAK